MTVTIDQAMRGAVRFADNEIIPHLRIMDEHGKIDIDRLYSAARPKFENKLSVDVPFIGSLKFDQNDVDKLYKFIQEA